MQERLQKIISAAGIASRRAAEDLILEGRVRVNGAVVTELGAKADPDRDHIKVDGKLINPKQPKTYLILNKPAGCVTTMFDPEGRPTVTELLKGVKARVYPVGRLDYDTEGLLLLTNDGDFAFRVTHPRHELPKTYHVKVKGVLDDRHIENLEKGVFLQDGKTAPARVKKLRKEESNSWVEITIHEGRKRQVRRMIDHTGHSVIKLKRVRVGDLHIGDLPLGAYRQLTSDEVKALQDLSTGGGHAVSDKAAKPGKRPAAAGHVPDFIEGPKPGMRSRKKTASPRTGEPAQHVAGPSAQRQSRPPEGRAERSGKKAWIPGQREKRPAGRGRGIRAGEERFERPSYGKDRPTWGRRPRTGGGTRPRIGQGRSFGDRTAPRERADRRPAGERPWKDSRSTGRPAFAPAGSHPGPRPARPESRSPRSEGRTGRQRDSRPRGAAGKIGSRPPMGRSASGPQGRPHGPRRTGPRPGGGSGRRPKGPGSRRS